MWNLNEVGFCPVVGAVLSSGVLSVWGVVLWGFILWGFVSVGFCQCGVLSCGVLSANRVNYFGTVLDFLARCIEPKLKNALQSSSR